MNALFHWLIDRMQHHEHTGSDGSGGIGQGAITSGMILDGTIINGDINGSAAIAYSKLNLASSIVNADVSGAAAIAYSKLNLATSIVNGDVSGSAAIAASKLATGRFGGSGRTTFPSNLSLNGLSTQAIEQRTLTVAASATANVSSVNAPYAFLLIAETAATGAMAIYAIAGGTATSYEIWDGSASYGTTIGASTFNIYHNGTAYVVQNTAGTDRTFQVTVIGLANF